MKLTDITIKNIKSFFEGNTKYYADKIFGSPEHIKEQYLYRLSQCKNDCLKREKCIYCGCPTKKKLFVNRSCNNGKRFPDMMSKEDWDEFKLQKKI